MAELLRADEWWLRWLRYGWCPYCLVDSGQPCEDRRWGGRKHRWCRHPHPERKVRSQVRHDYAELVTEGSSL